ncbi:NNP family nitrate/nitrite transporter-like MFS transporter [Amycolatopsis bartoniae]|uniref:MFS transporter n=1 Tax=Amycolatopsis bartoniae TaxID=941986 RepID=A0A8H9MEG5_9PSEU|nr:nitrate/nitrite transporter [Amycolatopsis bartoniae]MBB2938888.1 NNP family nitrate/nitrite transporter-like MFS transporter [Amycolatopsis bartoniae]TVS99707.1 NarK/NasA family nitrate transporter [Amycolatopsis bartoniae]GHF77379.1 MFS transporter [Amycolatopsis bartoniae]
MTTATRGRRWIDHWTPEDDTFWAATGRKVANRNLWFSIFSEHVGFSIWSLMSVLVLFMGTPYHLSAADKFLLTSTATLVGAFARIPYNFAVARFGGRNWTIISALLLLIPSITAAFVMKPGTPLGVFLLLSVLCGVGGGNFASSMTNINAFFPEKKKGMALGLNAGGGNLGVAVIQLVGLLIIATAGTSAPRLMLAVYIPLIVLAATGAALFMDNLASVRNDRKGMREVMKDAHCWVMSFLYIGTFGSFIGYSFAFGLVLQNQFGRTPLQAAYVTFLGPLLGSLARPVGGWLSDRIGGGRVTFWNFLGMAAMTVVLIVASEAKSLGLFTTAFVVLFVLTGVGNGSTYKMIPAIFKAKAKAAIDAGADEAAELLRARKLSGALIGLAGAIGAFGGLLVNLAFRQSFLSTGSGLSAFIGFLVFYGVCFVVTWAVYLRRSEVSEKQPALAQARV